MEVGWLGNGDSLVRGVSQAYSLLILRKLRLHLVSRYTVTESPYFQYFFPILRYTNIGFFESLALLGVP